MFMKSSFSTQSEVTILKQIYNRARASIDNKNFKIDS